MLVVTCGQLVNIPSQDCCFLVFWRRQEKSSKVIAPCFCTKIPHNQIFVVNSKKGVVSFEFVVHHVGGILNPQQAFTSQNKGNRQGKKEARWGRKRVNLRGKSSSSLANRFPSPSRGSDKTSWYRSWRHTKSFLWFIHLQPRLELIFLGVFKNWIREI